jgi:hypothetical protein
MQNKQEKTKPYMIGNEMPSRPIPDTDPGDRSRLFWINNNREIKSFLEEQHKENWYLGYSLVYPVSQKDTAIGHSKAVLDAFVHYYKYRPQDYSANVVLTALESEDVFLLCFGVNKKVEAIFLDIDNGAPKVIQIANKFLSEHGIDRLIPALKYKKK